MVQNITKLLPKVHTVIDTGGNNGIDVITTSTTEGRGGEGDRSGMVMLPTDVQVQLFFLKEWRFGGQFNVYGAALQLHRGDFWPWFLNETKECDMKDRKAISNKKKKKKERKEQARKEKARSLSKVAREAAEQSKIAELQWTLVNAAELCNNIDVPTAEEKRRVHQEERKKQEKRNNVFQLQQRQINAQKKKKKKKEMGVLFTSLHLCCLFIFAVLGLVLFDPSFATYGGTDDSAGGQRMVMLVRVGWDIVGGTRGVNFQYRLLGVVELFVYLLLFDFALNDEPNPYSLLFGSFSVLPVFLL